VDSFEIAYYLSRQQLLLLLSLIDGRPVAGLPPIKELEDWQKVSLSLVEDGRLRCENGKLVMDAGLSELLLTMKNAKSVYTIYGNGTEPGVMTVYPGEPPALLEFLPDGKVRLCGPELGELGQQVSSRLLPEYPMPGALLVSLPEDELLEECLHRWETRDVSLTDPPFFWLQIPEVRGVLEHWMPEEHTRYIWIEDQAAGIILTQDVNGVQAALDTVHLRQKLLRELGWEA